MIGGLLLLLLANEPTAAKPAQGLISGDDYPTSAMQRGEQGSVLSEILIDPEGKVDICRTLVSSHYRDLDEATCRLIKKRAVFEPAKDADGRAVYEVYRQVISWALTSAPDMDRAPDLDLTINQAPDGIRMPVGLTVSYLVKSDGTIAYCKPEKLKVPPIFGTLACQALRQSPQAVIRNSRGQPVDALNSSLVRFRVRR